MCYNNNGEGKISSEYLTKGATTECVGLATT